LIFNFEMLYLVATPIGNLKDITLRAIEVLKKVNLIACEDTRHSRILLKSYGIDTPTTSYFQHNRFRKAKFLLGKLQDGLDVALISDAGMPGILDPGYHFINLAIENNIPITVIPGATAFICALVLSGKPAHKFIFDGFLSNKASARCRRLKELKACGITVIFYESPHRIMAALKDVQDIFGDINIAVAREITKHFEEVKRGRVSDIIQHFSRQKVRGEFVVVI
ncbi:MAG: 16S rRNA (cytidine(1402)-2'-O)-methyltransferase, partial [Candidatus Omnitrophica bacterium]|nr:16S rRNA (cytidine(1402)-2'-O)-methyltransferase [Candidatus Omnitrophota bacterium]